MCDHCDGMTGQKLHKVDSDTHTNNSTYFIMQAHDSKRSLYSNVAGRIWVNAERINTVKGYTGVSIRWRVWVILNECLTVVSTSVTSTIRLCYNTGKPGFLGRTLAVYVPTPPRNSPTPPTPLSSQSPQAPQIIVEALGMIASDHVTPH